MPKTHKLTSAKAKKILADGEVNGEPLSKKQRKFFGAIAGGEKPRGAQDGMMVGPPPGPMSANLGEPPATPPPDVVIEMGAELIKAGLDELRAQGVLPPKTTVPGVGPAAPPVAPPAPIGAISPLG